MPNPIETLPHLHCCGLRPPCRLYHPQSSPSNVIPLPLSHTSITTQWCPNPCPCRLPVSLHFGGSSPTGPHYSVWLAPVGTLGAPRGRGSLPVAILACVPIVHLRCSIICQGHLGLASSAPFGPSAPLGDYEV